jgi:4-aminobutyrate aminotransferase
MYTTNIPSFEKKATDISDFLAPSLAEDWPKLLVERAKGSYLYTTDGREYLDFTSGIGVTNVGHCHPRVIDAARRQMEKMIHSSIGVTLHESLFTLCERLIEVLPTGLNMFFFGNSGSEAVEGALKLARYVKQRPAIIAFEGGFHGRNFGSTSVTSVKSKYRLHYEPLLPGIYFAPFAYPFRCPIGTEPGKSTEWSMRGIQNLFEHFVQPSEVAAFLVEPVQGEGGYIIPPPEFLQGLRKLCDEYDILLIFDEVQTGFGRTGEMFASQVFNIRPDIMAVAKGIASGFPLGATIAGRDLMKKWSAGSHGTTFGGNPVACAAAIATQDIIREENLLENSRKMGTRLLSGIKDFETRYSSVGEARGVGLMLAMEMVIPDETKTPNPKMAMSVLEGCLDRGLLAYMAGNKNQVVRLIPPLNVTSEQVDRALQIIDDSLAAAHL